MEGDAPKPDARHAILGEADPADAPPAFEHAILWILVPKPAVDGRGTSPQRGGRPDVLRWPATHRSAAGGSHGDQEVFDTDGVLFDKAQLQETMVAGAALPPVDDVFTLDVILQQLGIGHWRLRICMSPAAYFVSSWLMIR